MEKRGELVKWTLVNTYIYILVSSSNAHVFQHQQVNITDEQTQHQQQQQRIKDINLMLGVDYSIDTKYIIYIWSFSIS